MLRFTNMRLALLLAVVVATACSAQTSQPIPGASTSPGALATPSQWSLGPACRIPVMLSGQTYDTPGAWISLPDGNVDLDSTSNIDRGQGTEGLSYNRAFNRWIPADWNHLSPDGRKYVLTHEGAVKIVDVATGVSREVAMPLGIGAWEALDFTTAGVYMTPMGGMGPAPPGLWVMSPDSGQMRQLDGTQSWSQVDSRAAWGVSVGGDTQQLRRLDLKSLTVTTYLTVALHEPLQSGDRSLELISLDADGRPLVLQRNWQRPYPWDLALITAPNLPSPVDIPTYWAAGWPIQDNYDPFQTARALHGLLLSRGIWMYGSNSFSGLALLGSDGVVRELTTHPYIAQIAGGCH